MVEYMSKLIESDGEFGFSGGGNRAAWARVTAFADKSAGAVEFEGELRFELWGVICPRLL